MNETDKTDKDKRKVAASTQWQAATEVVALDSESRDLLSLLVDGETGQCDSYLISTLAREGILQYLHTSDTGVGMQLEPDWHNPATHNRAVLC